MEHHSLPSVVELVQDSAEQSLEQLLQIDSCCGTSDHSCSETAVRCAGTVDSVCFGLELGSELGSELGLELGLELDSELGLEHSSERCFVGSEQSCFFAENGLRYWCEHKE